MTPLETPADVRKARDRITWAKYVYRTLGLLVVLAVLIVVGIALVTARTSTSAARAQGEANATKIDELQDQLDKQSDRDICSAALGRQITSANANYISKLGGLVIVLADTKVGTQERDDATLVSFQAIRDADARYQAVVTQRDSWFASGAILPCPITVHIDDDATPGG